MSRAYSSTELRLRADCQEEFEVGPDSNTAISPTGETFVELSKMSPTEQDARQAALDTFRTYARGRGRSLYWRVYPEVEERHSTNFVTATHIDGWAFYMRVLVSDKPIKYQTLAHAKEMR